MILKGPVRYDNKLCNAASSVHATMKQLEFTS